MTLTPPLSATEALEHLRDALGVNYAGPVDVLTLTRALNVDAVTSGPDAHYRPWGTAARLIRENTEYEVTDGLAARIDRKLGGLTATQRGADASAGILELVLAREAALLGLPVSGMVATDGVF